MGNYLSFKNSVTLSMVSSAIQEHSDSHVFQANSHFKLLKSAAIYGANASGKSNLFAAMAFMSQFVKNSSKDSQAEEDIDVDRFQLSTETENKPATFEIVFIYENTTYRYGFKVDRKRVHNEWLYSTSKKQQKERLLFNRVKNKYDIGKLFEEGKDLNVKTRDNALFLSVVAQFNGDISKKLLKWFKNFNVTSGLYDKHLSKEVITRNKESFLKLVRAADLGIEDIKIEEKKFNYSKFLDELLIKESEGAFLSNLPGMTTLTTLHKKYDENMSYIGLEKFDMKKQESKGTQKLVSILGPILDALLEGKILVIDELDSRLHPLITSYIIKLFHSSESNPKNSQLIFNTHDTNLLSRKIFRRDQIWFTEKDRYGSSDLYSLIDYKVRNDASYEKDYLLGKYGSIPFLGDFEWQGED